jgi:hypothetical protein
MKSSEENMHKRIQAGSGRRTQLSVVEKIVREQLEET